MTKKKLGNVIQNIQKGAKDSESYGTSLVGEHLIVSAYKQMPLSKLVELRYIMNRIIKKKKEMKRVKEAKNEKRAKSN